MHFGPLRVALRLYGTRSEISLIGYDGSSGTGLTEPRYEKSAPLGLAPGASATAIFAACEINVLQRLLCYQIMH